MDPPSPPSISSLLAEWRSRVPRWLWAAGGLVALVLLAVIAVVAVRAPAGPTPRFTLPQAGGSPTTTPGPAGSSGAPGTQPGSTATAAAGMATVHAAGAVASPGVYTVPSGARVADVLLAAGGALAEADIDRLNLAARVTDGDRVYVMRKGESGEAVSASGPVGATAGGAGGGGGGSGTAPAGPLDLNTATAEQLDTLPGVGPATAQAIITYRTRHGRFRSVTELLEVPGIGPAKLEAVRALVKV